MAKISIPLVDELLACIDRAARRVGIPQSAYLRQLAARELGLALRPGRHPRARKAMASLERLFREQGVSEEATAAIRAERDLR
jgi:hypothetical protein